MVTADAGIRLVLVRTVSVKASLGPLTVFSTSGGEMPRFSPVLASKATASAAPSNTTRQNPLTSKLQAVCKSVTALATAEYTTPSRHWRTISPALPCSSCVMGCRIKSAISEPDVNPSIKNAVACTVSSRRGRTTRSAAPANTFDTASADKPSGYSMTFTSAFRITAERAGYTVLSRLWDMTIPTVDGVRKCLYNRYRTYVLLTRKSCGKE